MARDDGEHANMYGGLSLDQPRPRRQAAVSGAPSADRPAAGGRQRSAVAEPLSVERGHWQSRIGAVSGVSRATISGVSVSVVTHPQERNYGSNFAMNDTRARHRFNERRIVGGITSAARSFDRNVHA